VLSCKRTSEWAELLLAHLPAQCLAGLDVVLECCLVMLAAPMPLTSARSQVSIDANGVLKVTHLVPLAAQTGRAAPAASSWAATPAMSAFGNTQQGGMSGSQVAVVQFVSLPVEEDD
jgi:hypothetical protein